MQKTNVMRILDQKKIDYQAYDYSHTDAVSGREVAEALGMDPEILFKTLVTVGKTGGHYVFLVPVDKELDLKKAARAAGEKSIEMIREKELLPLTGYVHGGCSPVGMKKQFPTYIDASAEKLESMVINGGKVGYQIKLKPKDLWELIRGHLADL